MLTAPCCDVHWDPFYMVSATWVEAPLEASVLVTLQIVWQPQLWHRNISHKNIANIARLPWVHFIKLLTCQVVLTKILVTICVLSQIDQPTNQPTARLLELLREANKIIMFQSCEYHPSNYNLKEVEQIVHLLIDPQVDEVLPVPGRSWAPLLHGLHQPKLLCGKTHFFVLVICKHNCHPHKN